MTTENKEWDKILSDAVQAIKKAEESAGFEINPSHEELDLQLFTKTCRKDLEWFKLCVRSIFSNLRYTSLEWVIVCDQGEKDEINKLMVGESIQFIGHEKIRVIEIQELWGDCMHIQNGYFRQQWVKMNAHRAFPKGYILNWDSDTIALKQFSATDFKHLGKPILYFTPFNDLMTGRDRTVHEGRRRFVCRIFEMKEVAFEWMRNMPIWSNAEILRVGAERPEWGRFRYALETNAEGISEFNIIGELTHQFFPDAYEFRNTQSGNWQFWTGPLDSSAITHQAWSGGGISNEFRDKAQA